MARALAITLALALAGCGSDGTPDGSAEMFAGKEGSAGTGSGSAGLSSLQDGQVTPNEDRIATLGLLNKRNNLTRDLVVKVGESRRAGNVIVRLSSCERTAPWELPEEEGAFVQVFVFERPKPQDDEEWRRVFSGWLFKNSPSLNVVEHPIYDVWVKDCAMKYPGEDAKPAAAASASNAENASGSEAGASPSE